MTLAYLAFFFFQLKLPTHTCSGHFRLGSAPLLLRPSTCGWKLSIFAVRVNTCVVNYADDSLSDKPV